MKLSRRELSIGLGLTLLLGPLLGDVTRPRVAHAGPSKTAKRLFLFFTPNGTAPARYWPQGANGSGFSFAPGSILEPLSPIQSDIVLCKGINFTGFDNHEPGMRGMLTGNPSAGAFGGASVDQYIAGKLPVSTRYRSIELGVLTDPWGAGGQTRMDYSGPGVFVNPQQDPRAAFTRLFAAAAGGAGAAAAIAARRKSVLDFVKADASSLRAQLGADERRKMDDHLSAIRAVEQSLFPSGGGGAMSCGTPTAPGAMDPNSQASFPAVGKAQMDLAVLAMQCGLAPVVSLQWSHTVSPVVFSWLGLSAGHHDLSHAQNDDFVKAERWYAEQFAYLVTQMKQKGLLADSLVVWIKELGDSSLHNAIDVPFVMAGGAGGALATGRYLDFKGVSHQKLLASMVQAMGVDPSPLGADAAGLTGLLS
jgi:hypothetical protein